MKWLELMAKLQKLPSVVVPCMHPDLSDDHNLVVDDPILVVDE